MHVRLQYFIQNIKHAVIIFRVKIFKQKKLKGMSGYTSPLNQGLRALRANVAGPSHRPDRGRSDAEISLEERKHKTTLVLALKLGIFY